MEPTVGPVPAIAELGPRFFEFVERLERPVVFMDLETTGVDVTHDRIVEVCLLRVSPLPVAIEAPLTWRVNPGVKIPMESTAIHGIEDADVTDAPTFAAIAPVLVDLLRDVDLGGFAVSRMDVRMLQKELDRAGQSLDLLDRRIVDAQVVFHRREPRDLTAALRFYRDRDHAGAHGATSDTVASLEVFAGQLERYGDLDASVAALDELTTSQSAAFVDRERRFVWRDGEPTFNFGKLRGTSLRVAASDPTQRKYLRFIVQGPFDDDVKSLVGDALAGKIRRRS
jgi:DNA polymerase-3 subunit epsilon